MNLPPPRAVSHTAEGPAWLNVVALGRQQTGEGEKGRRGRELLFQAGADRLDRPRLFRELAGLHLGIDQVAIDRQLKAAAARRNHLQFADLLLVRAEQLARQTDGLRLVISHRTVLEFYFHMLSLKITFCKLR